VHGKSDLAEMLHRLIFEGLQTTAGVNLETGSKILPAEGILQILFWGHISAAE